MLQALASRARRFIDDLQRSWAPRPLPCTDDLETISPSPPSSYQPLERIVLTDGVGRTLFEEYAGHRSGARGEEETGWVLLGLREANEAVVLATLPAGAEREAGVGHVRFNSAGQILGSRIVRQSDRRLVILGVVHTHPGSLRHPSNGDFRGDSQWVGQLRGKEGVFGIGTADAKVEAGGSVARQPRPHMQILGELCFSWYVLGDGDRKYRPIPVCLTIGPDLARPLHSVWATLEEHALRLDRLFRQQKALRFEPVMGQQGPALAVTVPLAEPKQSLRVLLEGERVDYFLLRDGTLLAADSQEGRVDRGIYLLLAELAAMQE